VPEKCFKLKNQEMIIIGQDTCDIRKEMISWEFIASVKVVTNIVPQPMGASSDEYVRLDHERIG
jgi:hypothetical protein